MFLTTFEAKVFNEEAGAVLKMGLSLKPNHHSQVELVQICEAI